MNTNLSRFWEWLRSLPIWLRVVVLALIAALVLIFSTSCGQTVRVTVRDTGSGVQIDTKQFKTDSSGTHINIKPNITFGTK